MFEKYVIKAELTIDRDMIPGWGHQSVDMFDLAFSNFLRQSHYNPSVKLDSVMLVNKSNPENSVSFSPHADVKQDTQDDIRKLFTQFDQLVEKRAQEIAAEWREEELNRIKGATDAE